MSTFAVVVVGFALLVLLYSLVRYLGSAHNNLVEARERCEKAWSDVDVLLERRAEEVGRLADVAREHVSHEREVLEDVMEARKRAIEAQHPEEAADAMVALRESVENVYDLAGEYPELASSERLDELTTSIRTIEQRLENRREQYNEAVSAYNARLNKVPEWFVASYYGFERRTPFVASADARDGVNVSERLDLSADD
ncbi:LemA family protein [Halobacteriales archaeon QS_1_68_20]|nr:MAG: LemA family protein [Halobacteriales archaeon QS_1_68_20]